MDDSLYFAQKIALLQSKIDSFNNIATLKEINFRVTEQQSIINQVDSFYNSAWIKLIVIITLLGIVIPVLANYYQKKTFKDLTDFILNQIRENYDRKIQELKGYNETQLQLLTNQYNTELGNIKEDYKNFNIEMDASLMYLQGKTLQSTDRHHSAFGDFVKATQKWLSSKKAERAKVTITNAFISIKKINSKSELSKVEVRGFNLEKDMAKLKQSDNYEMIRDKVELIENHISGLK